MASAMGSAGGLCPGRVAGPLCVAVPPCDRNPGGFCRGAEERRPVPVPQQTLGAGTISTAVVLARIHWGKDERQAGRGVGRGMGAVF